MFSSLAQCCRKDKVSAAYVLWNIQKEMDCKTIFLLAFFQCLCLIQPKEALFVNKKSLSENIQDGLKFAGKIFGETAIREQWDCCLLKLCES